MSSHGNLCFQFFIKIDIFYIFISILGPGTYFIMILDPVAPFSQSMSPWRAMATHFGPKTVIFRPPHNANICYRRPKILILGLCMYCNQRNLYCRYKYMPRRYKLYVSNIQIICFKATKSMLQIHNLYVVHTEFLCCKYTHGLCLRQRFLCIT